MISCIDWWSIHGSSGSNVVKKPRIIVGTPGRIIDHLDRNNLDLSTFNYVVLDETDRMLDMGFSAPIAKIFDNVAVKRQTLLFSATLPKGIEKASAKYLNNPARIEIGQANSASQNIVQTTEFVSKEGKFEALVHALQQHEESAIVFMNSKFATEKLAKRLKVSNISASAIHGDLRQIRESVLFWGFETTNLEYWLQRMLLHVELIYLTFTR